MKKVIAFSLALTMMLVVLSACGHEHKFGEWTILKEATCIEDGLKERACSCGEKETETIPKIDAVISTDEFSVNGIYIDSSYAESGLNLVYLFYTLSAKTTNLTANQLLIDIEINGTNTYEPITIKDYIPYYTDYYYSSYNEDVYIGSSLNVCQTYEIPKGEFAEEKLVLLNSTYIDVSDIQFTTNAVKSLSGIANIAKDLNESVYTKKYQEEQAMLEKVDSATAKAIKAGLNGYYWTFYAYPSSYQIEFSAPNNFDISSGFGLSNSGTYTVHAGCIVLYYPSNGEEIIVPFTCNADGSPAFDNNGSIMMPTLANQFVVDPDYDGRE